MEYVIKHKNTGIFENQDVYLKRFGNIGLNHYVVDINEATKFDRRNGRAMLGKFRHPENWELKVVVGTDGRKKKRKR